MVAEHRGLPAAKAVIGDRHRDRHIHADHADIDRGREIARRITVTGEDGGAVAIFMVHHQLARLVIALRTQHRKHRPENLVAIDRHVGGHPVEKRAADEEAVLVALQLQPAAVDDHIGAVFLALVNIALDPRLGFGGDHRTHLDARLVILADLQRAHLRRQLLDEPVGGVVTHGQNGRDRHAALAGRAIGRAHGGIDGLVHIGVGHDDHVVLRAAQRLHALAVGAAARIDVFADGGGADKADGGHIGMVEDRVDGFLVAMHDIETAFGKPSLGQHPRQHHRRAGVALRRLEDEGVAAGQRHREHPHRHHRREVERGNAGDHADRLAHREAVDIAGDLRRILALQRMRDAAGELDHLDAARDLALGVVEGLAVLRGNQRRQLVKVGLDQVTEVEHHLRTAGWRGAGPARKGGSGSRNGVADLGQAGQRHRCNGRAGGRIEHILLAAAGAGGFCAADVMHERHGLVP